MLNCSRSKPLIRSDHLPIKILLRISSSVYLPTILTNTNMTASDAVRSVENNPSVSAPLTRQS
eukprot:14050092-Ditylum_brightwellii.AAC.1